MLTPEICGASQTACNIINATFLSLDGFAALRAQCDEDDNGAMRFAAELARVTDREIKDSRKLDRNEALGYVYDMMDDSNYKSSKKSRLAWATLDLLYEMDTHVPRSLVRETFLEVDADQVNG